MGKMLMRMELANFPGCRRPGPRRAASGCRDLKYIAHHSQSGHRGNVMNRSAASPLSLLLLHLALAATLAAAGAVPAHAASPAEPPKGLAAPPQATPMPAFELTGYDGSKARSSDLRDKVAVFRFWATW
jgi:hypothetical protein